MTLITLLSFKVVKKIAGMKKNNTVKLILDFLEETAWQILLNFPYKFFRSNPRSFAKTTRYMLSLLWQTLLLGNQ